jgi:hypothetical protein
MSKWMLRPMKASFHTTNGEAQTRHLEMQVFEAFRGLSSQQYGMHGRISAPIWTDRETFACISLLLHLALAR